MTDYPLDEALADLERTDPDVRAAAETLRRATDEIPRLPICIHAPEGINQTTFERLKDLIRAGGIEWRRSQDPSHNAWKDGIIVDLDEDDQLTTIAAYIAQHALAAALSDTEGTDK